MALWSFEYVLSAIFLYVDGTLSDTRAERGYVLATVPVAACIRLAFLFCHIHRID